MEVYTRVGGFGVANVKLGRPPYIDPADAKHLYYGATPEVVANKGLVKFDYSHLIGDYVVVRAYMGGGGGTGHGPNDVYPDGWDVTAKKLSDDGGYDPDGEEIRFYQSGSFTAMNKPEDVPVLRTMKQTFV